MSSIFMVGPEASGKTVFATMMLHTIESQPQVGIDFLEKNNSTKKYIQNIQDTLRRKEWPSSTKGDEFYALAWEWKIHNQFEIDVNLTDAPGQNIRDELINEHKEFGIVEKIKEASIVILIVDLIGHYNETNRDKQSENAFIIQETLRMIKPDQSLYLVLSKADLLSQYLKKPKDWSDYGTLFPIIKELMPEFRANFFAPNFENESWKIFAVSAVETITNPNGDKPSRIPKSPLVSHGMSELLRSLVDSLLDAKVDCPNMASHLKDGNIICSRCEGLGHLNDGWFFDTSCPACNGSKVILCTTCQGSLKIKQKYLQIAQDCLKQAKTSTIEEKVVEIIMDKLNVTKKQCKLDASFKDLGADSLDIAEVVMEFEDEFDIEISENETGVNTIREAVRYVEEAQKQKRKNKK